jgi:hypothetical protein
MDDQLVNKLVEALIQCYSENLNHKDTEQLVREYERWVSDDDELLAECRASVAINKMLD